MERFDKSIGCSKICHNIGDIEAINYESVCELEKELEPYHIYSLVFLLYDVAHTALQRLTIYQRVSRDNSRTNLLSQWVLGVQNKYPMWRSKFVEALAICQLYRIIRKLGLNVTNIKNYFQPYDLNKTVNINHTKKVLYIICENVTDKLLYQIKNALGTYEINVSEYQTCELVFLKLMSEHFISGNFSDKEAEINVDKLVLILDRFPELQVFAENLKKKQNEIRYNKTNTDDHQKNKESNRTSTNLSDQDENNLDEIFSMLNTLAGNDLPEMDNISSKQKFSSAEIYPLKNRLRPGVCYIINQEEFTDPQLNRTGSSKDSMDLKHTMENLKFEVITHSNLKFKDMMRKISDIIKYRVHHDDSVFVLCILSHGIKDHVFSADSIPIKIDEIQNMFDAEEATHLFNIPKIFIIEACQIEGEKFYSQFEADSPRGYHIRKSDCLIFYATASQLEAYRHPEHGTIFIQTLCRMLKKYAEQDDVLSIFTRVNNMVRLVCEKIEKEQIPTISTTLVKKLYLM